ncbi:uncharacterized protein AB9W97_014197 [Spinachia spinachia]
MSLGGAFRVLLLLLSGASAVAPPGGLELTCHNQQVTVRWEDGGPRRGTSYRVDVVASAGGGHTDETTGNQYDLTPFVWASEDRYLAFYSVYVTAREGENRSEPTRTQTFTFNSLKPAEIMCKFDFPPVDLKKTDSGATLSFRNPLSFYRELNETARSESPTFTFIANSNGSEFKGSCDAGDGVCRLALPPGEPAAEMCVSELRGSLARVPRVKASAVDFRATGPVCAIDSADSGALAFALMLLLFFVVISGVVVLICRAKAWTMKGVPAKLPMALVLHPSEGNMGYAPLQREDVSPVTVTENVAFRNPSVSTEEDLQLGPCSYIGRPHGGLSDGDSEETDTAAVDSSHYDRRKMLEVDMGDGDVATGYSNRGDDL